MKWTVLHQGVDTAQNHMDMDQKLLKEISTLGHPLLRFYDWKGPCATYGYFIDPLHYLEPDGIKKIGLTLGRRPTGGGVVFHLTDLAFSVLVPAAHLAYSVNTLENYAFINTHVVRAVQGFTKKIAPTLLQKESQPLDEASRNFCMAKPTIYDVMIEGKKIGGAAQRRTRDGFLHQGTISIAMPEEALLRTVLKTGTQVMEAMKEHSYVLADEKQLKETRAELRRLLELEFLKNER